MDKKVWLSPRALRLHAVILVVVPAFMALCVWQIERATSGNELSWAYVFEWPFFAAYAVYMWWRLLHATPETAPAAAAGDRSGEDGRRTPQEGRDAAERRDERDKEDAELVAYNAYLARLAARDRAAGR